MDNELQPNEVLFVNWESINKEKNTMIKENETNKNLYSFINRAKLNNTEIIVIIDEDEAKRTMEILKEMGEEI